MRGATAVELAILTPVLFMLSIGAMELGRGVWTKHTLTYVAREAARYASVRSANSDDPATTDKIASRARSEIVGINPADVAVQVTWNPGNQPGATVRVRLDYQFHPVTRLLSFGTLQLSSQSEQTISY
jgi:Flp pilus assembly protein TadG